MSSLSDDTTNLNSANIRIPDSSEMVQKDDNRTLNDAQHSIIQSNDIDSQYEVPMNLLPAGKLGYLNFLASNYKNYIIVL